jgi:hypothetical protein
MDSSICNVCGIKQIDSLFITSIGKPLTPKELKYKVCQYAKKTGCINTFTGTVPAFQEEQLNPKIWDLYFKNNSDAP